MLFLDFYLHPFHHHEKLGIRFHHPLHTTVHHEVLLTWWWWLENSVNHYLIWKINSHLIQAIEVPRQSERMLTSWAILLHLVGKRTCQRSHTSQHGHEPEIKDKHHMQSKYVTWYGHHHLVFLSPWPKQHHDLHRHRLNTLISIVASWSSR